jgi:hypothetical protein
MVDFQVMVGIPATGDTPATVAIREMLCMAAATRRMVVIPNMVDIQVPPAIPAMGNFPGMADTQATVGIQAKTTEDTQAITVLQCMADTQAKTTEATQAITDTQCTAGIPVMLDTQWEGGIRRPTVVDTRGTAAIPDMACPPVTAVVTQGMRDTQATTDTPVTTVIQEVRRATIHGVTDQGTLNLPMVTARTMAAVIQTRR